MSNEYYIHSRDNEYYQIMSVIKERLIQVESVEGKALSVDYYTKALAELEENKGSNITAQQVNAIFKALLEFVPEEIKNKHY